MIKPTYWHLTLHKIGVLLGVIWTSVPWHPSRIQGMDSDPLILNWWRRQGMLLRGWHLSSQLMMDDGRNMTGYPPRKWRRRNGCNGTNTGGNLLESWFKLGFFFELWKFSGLNRKPVAILPLISKKNSSVKNIHSKIWRSKSMAPTDTVPVERKMQVILFNFPK